MNRIKLATCLFVVLSGWSAPLHAQQQVMGAAPEAKNMKLVGMNDLQARSGYQPTIHHQGDRWIAYIGHHGGTDDVPDPINPQTGKAEPNGTSIVDVTDPAHPKYLRHIPGQEGSTKAAALRWSACAMERRCRRGILQRSTCCALSAARHMKSGTSPTRRIRFW